MTKTRRHLWSAIGVLLLAFVHHALLAGELRLELLADRPSVFQVFYSTGAGFNQTQSAQQAFQGLGRPETLVFPLPDQPIDGLRFDPGSEPGRILLRDVRILDASGRERLTIPPYRLEPAQQILPTPLTADARATAAFVVPPGSNDPILVVDDAALATRLSGHTPPRLTPSLFSVGAVLVVALFLAVAVRRCRASRGTETRRRLLIAAALAAGFFLVFAGLRFARFAGDISWAPYLDQFEGEWAGVLRPLGEGGLTLGQLFAPHNDHRIVTTRLAAAVVQVLNREWDNRVLATVGVLVQAATFAWFASRVRQALPVRFAWPVLAVMLGWAALVCDWENLVNGFQLQFHLLIVGSVLAVYLLPQAPHNTTRGWLGWAAALLAGLSMTSGLLAAVAAGAGLLYALVRSRTSRLGPWLLFLATVALALVLFTTRAHFPAHDFLRATGFRSWFDAWTTYAPWPLPPGVWSTGLVWAPWTCVVGLALLRRGRGVTPFTLF